MTERERRFVEQVQRCAELGQGSARCACRGARQRGQSLCAEQRRVDGERHQRSLKGPRALEQVAAVESVASGLDARRRERQTARRVREPRLTPGKLPAPGPAKDVVRSIESRLPP
jgi:hypothetical protein